MSSGITVLATVYDLQDIISVNLQQAIQVCVDIGMHILADFEIGPPETVGETFAALSQAKVISEALAGRLKGAVGFRYIAVHAYRTIDWVIVYSLITTHLDDFIDYARSISKQLDRRGS